MKVLVEVIDTPVRYGNKRYLAGEQFKIEERYVEGIEEHIEVIKEIKKEGKKEPSEKKETKQKLPEQEDKELVEQE